MGIKFVHTNLIARDWRKLAKFYIDVFGCQPQHPQRDLYGEWVEKLTNIKDVRIRGVHLVLPGYEDGPTLEIFEYEPTAYKSEIRINEQGFGHIAFHVDNMAEVISRLVENGGEFLGEIIQKDYAGIGLLTAVYAKDPEGNHIEIQNWDYE